MTSSRCPGPDQRARALLDGYIAAFEHSDAGLLEQVLRTDATLEATPFREWQAGPAMCIHMVDAYVLGTPGDWRMIATAANGQPAAVVYHRDADGALRAAGVVVLAPTATGVSRVIKFHDPAAGRDVRLPGRARALTRQPPPGSHRSRFISARCYRRKCRPDGRGPVPLHAVRSASGRGTFASVDQVQGD